MFLLNILTVAPYTLAICQLIVMQTNTNYAYPECNLLESKHTEIVVSCITGSTYMNIAVEKLHDFKDSTFIYQIE